MLVSSERGKAITIAINETYNVLMMNGRNPKSPLKGFQFPEVSRVQILFSFIIGRALRNRLIPITRMSKRAKRAMPCMMCRAELSFIALIKFIWFY
jgi:hypothetical protein